MAYLAVLSKGLVVQHLDAEPTVVFLQAEFEYFVPVAKHR